MEDSEIDKQCLKIYERHWKVIDRINEVKPGAKDIYQTLGGGVVSEMGPEWTYYATNSYCAVYRKEWMTRHNPTSYVSFIHYEFNDVGLDKILCSIHIENLDNSGTRERFINILKTTEIVKVPGINLSRAQVVYSKRPSIPIEEDEEKAIKHGIQRMCKIIKETSEYLDAASKACMVAPTQ